MILLYNEEVGRRNNFDLIRFLLAISVMFTHAFGIHQNGRSEPLKLLSNNQLTVGIFAVNFFFIISGFLVLQSWRHSKGVIDFLVKRILRIYPAFIVVCILSAFVFCPLGNGNSTNPFLHWKSYVSQIEYYKLFYSIFFLSSPEIPATFASSPFTQEINTSLWTIWYEFVCYLVLMAMGVFKVFNFKLVPLVLFVFAIVFYILDFNSEYFEIMNRRVSIISEYAIERIHNLGRLIMFFLGGTCFYYYRAYIPKSRWLLLLSIVVLVLNLQLIRQIEIAQVIFGSYLLFYFAFTTKINASKFAKYGDFSYGIYLYGWPVQQLVIIYFGDKLSLAGTLFCSLLIVIPLAMLSWHLIEKQFLKFKHFSTIAFFNLSLKSSGQY
ncbi:MAG: acyltransferase [Bacteroidota bacterium]